MHVLSVNAASPATIRFNDEDVETGIYKLPLDGQVSVTRLGISGDSIVDKSVHGGIDQAVYLYHAEDYEWWSQQLGKDLAPGTFGENITLTGMAEKPFVIGDRMIINNVELEISAPRTPCFKLATRMGDPGFVKAFAKAQRPGAYARVISEGVIETGSRVSLYRTSDDYASVQEVFVEWHEKVPSLAVLKKALASPIAAVHRRKLQEWHDLQVAGEG